jgi:hypothetical protein
MRGYYFPANFLKFALNARAVMVTSREVKQQAWVRQDERTGR